MDINSAIINKDSLQKIIDNREYNNLICEYYRQFSKNGGSVAFSGELLGKKDIRISSCNKYWYMDYYPNQKIKDFQSTRLCHDKFCANCKKVKQAGRMAKYIPEIEPYSDYLYHMTLTVPNCIAADLRLTVKHMSSCFKALIEIISAVKKRRISGLDFESWGYLGAIRSLEVTFKDNSYHPHYHVCLCLQGLSFRDKDRNIINSFSYSYGKIERLFHEAEVLIQKIWYLLINKEFVTLDNINNLPIGYSCTIDKFQDGHYNEIFKYMTKETKEDGKLLTYNNFISLYYGLYCIKQLQGYGIFYHITDSIDLEVLEQMYDEFINEIRKKESPQATYDRPIDLINDTDNLLISRKSYFKYLSQALNDK